ncbi:hypothetical protein B1B04_18960 [Lysinibacillus sp. KCTC 33748]|uniref:hypothetical protein n=1 Tax=unclassified Lysinibacillus TaxID=2636778 RepID=UPI0009A8FA7F|nr:MULTISPECIES: hypothetical protein [unclassified Lysinibacillus]OXS70242.1 hypothetical protein B1B04_18960 [Lysinibacillus sp. KCTC 33748]SKC05143.1 hypothetical protein SAMN06295926_11981 [Lysinibacillus sp. AC-3]
MQFLVRFTKFVFYVCLAIILACNIYGVETVLSFIPNIKITKNNGDLQLVLDKKILLFTFTLAILEAIDNFLAIRRK